MMPIIAKAQDAVTVKIFSSICKVSDCVDHNIALIEDLSKNRTPMRETAGKSVEAVACKVRGAVRGTASNQ
jgi:hypothetical protein